MPLPSSTKSAPKSSNSRKKKRIQLRSIAAAASSSTSNTTSKPSLSSSKFKSKSTAILPPPRRAIPIPKQNRLPKAGDWVETRALVYSAVLFISRIDIDYDHLITTR